nr:kinesin motor domain-containing protein [Tanacetum cinerariifolium]GEZ24226.1 kinesin motor domain-containing protein [Tanacetum cinerariifolium]
MQEKFNSLRSATIALTEIQYTEINKMVEVPKGDTLLEEENKQLIVQQIIDELVAINNRLDNVKEYFRSKHDQVVFEDLYECTNHSSAPISTFFDDEDLLQDISVEPTSSLTSRHYLLLVSDLHPRVKEEDLQTNFPTAHRVQLARAPTIGKSLCCGDVFSNSVAEKVVQ